MTMKPIERIATADELPPNGVPVIVCGGIAMRKTGGEWFTGMEDPRYERQLEWEPTWWARIPTYDDFQC